MASFRRDTWKPVFSAGSSTAEVTHLPFPSLSVACKLAAVRTGFESFARPAEERRAMPLPEFKQLVDEARSQISEIGPNDLRRMQQSGEDFTLVDVRERDEQAKGIIPGAVSLPRGILEVNIDKITTDKDRKLVLYCGGGSRSALAALNLKKMGFRNVFSLAGGYHDWREGDTY
jgi:rhodanese-related sulfurtransferase